MGLSDDQRAMLRLLAQRGEQGYDDIAALMGLSVDEVRVKVAEALAQLDDEGVLASDKAPPATAEPAADEPPAAAEPASAAPREPAAPPPPPKPPKAAKKASRPRRQPPKLSLPSGGGLRAAIAAGVVVIALVVVIIIVSVGGGEDSTGATTSSASASGGAETTAAAEAASGKGANPKEVTKAILKAVDGSEASGVAIFGKVKKSLALELAAEKLEPSAKGSSYTVWLSQSPQRMLPLASTKVSSSGKIAGQYEIPVEVLAYLANETFKDLVVTRTDDKTLEAALKAATEAERAPTYTGTEVLSGAVTGPVVGAAKRIKEAKAEEEGK